MFLQVIPTDCILYRCSQSPAAPAGPSSLYHKSFTIIIPLLARYLLSKLPWISPICYTCKNSIITLLCPRSASSTSFLNVFLPCHLTNVLFSQIHIGLNIIQTPCFYLPIIGKLSLLLSSLPPVQISTILSLCICQLLVLRFCLYHFNGFLRYQVWYPHYIIK